MSKKASLTIFPTFDWLLGEGRSKWRVLFICMLLQLVDTLITLHFFKPFLFSRFILFLVSSFYPFSVSLHFVMTLILDTVLLSVAFNQKYIQQVRKWFFMMVRMGLKLVRPAVRKVKDEYIREKRLFRETDPFSLSLICKFSFPCPRQIVISRFVWRVQHVLMFVETRIRSKKREERVKQREVDNWSEAVNVYLLVAAAVGWLMEGRHEQYLIIFRIIQSYTWLIDLAVNPEEEAMEWTSINRTISRFETNTIISCSFILRMNRWLLQRDPHIFILFFFNFISAANLSSFGMTHSLLNCCLFN